MYLEAWFYLPANLQFTPGSFLALFRPLYERYWGPNSTPYYWYNGATFGIWGSDGRGSRPTAGKPLLHLYHNHGEVDNGGDLTNSIGMDLFLSDMQQAPNATGWDWIEPYKSNPSLRWTVENLLGKWFKVKCRIKRNYSTWSDGRIAWWIALPPDYHEIPLYLPSSGSDNHGWNPDTPVRTIGVTPTLMAQRQAADYESAYFCTGFSIYTDIGANPNTVYLDDTLLTGTSQVATIYTLTLIQSGGGVITVTPNQTIFQAGATATVNAVPSSGYVFDHWKVDGADTALTIPTMGVTMNSDHSVQAVFTAILPVAITISPLSSSIMVGNSVVLTAIPTQGQAPYTVSWVDEVSGSTVGTGLNYVFTPTQAGTYHIHASVTDAIGGIATSQTAQITVTTPPHTVTIQVSGAGSTTPAVGSYTANDGSTLAVTATPSSGNQFNGWTVNGVPNNLNPLSIQIKADTLIIANFIPITHSISIQVIGSGITNPVAGSYIANDGASLSVSATPNTGNRFVKWTVNGVDYTTNPLSTVVTANLSIVATFTPITYTVTIQVSGSGVTSPVAGSYTYNYGDTLTVTASPASGNRFSGWTINGSPSTINPLSFSVTANLTITASFLPITHTVVIQISGSGTTNPTTGSYTVNEGTTFTVTANPNSGYNFSGWTVNGATMSANPLSIQVASDVTIVANFIQIVYLLTLTSSPSGITFTINGASNSTPYQRSLAQGNYTIVFPSNITISGSTYNFVSWQDGATSPTKVVSLTADTILQVSYQLQPPPPPAKGNIEIHSYINGVEVISSGSIIGTGESFSTPITLSENQGTYIIQVTAGSQTNQQTAIVVSGQTVRLDFQFTVIPTYILQITANLTGLQFTVNGSIQVTPYSATLPQGSYIIVMPSNVTVGTNIYNFQAWQDASTSPTLALNLIANTVLNATYQLQTPPPPAKGNIEVHTYLNSVEVVGIRTRS